MMPALQYLSSSKILSLLFLTILILTATASSTSTHQIALTDADKKQILSLLFKDELAASQNEKELMILLSPRTNAGWPLDLPGIRFQKLSYAEEKQASEYYELGDLKINRDFVEVWLSKGNYCKKVGAVHQFRQKHGQWIVKTHRLSETFSSSGTVCAACKTGSGSVYKLKTETAVSKERKDLLLTGNVLATRCERTEKAYIRCKIDLSLDFINQGAHPIIILQPHGEYEFWQGARSLALTKADSETNNYVYSAAAWPSFYKTEMYQQLAQDLDQANPPANFTRVIAPGESWNWKTTIQLGLAEDNTCSGSIGVEIGWNEIKKLSSPVWLKVSYEMWPFNVENFKKGLGGHLRERWRSYGTLYLEEKSDQIWFAHVTSEPIGLDFQHVQLN